MSTLAQSMKPVASFVFENLQTEGASKKLCLFHGHYDTSELINKEDGKFALSYCNPSALEDAGYSCDQVADNYNESIITADGDYTIKISNVSPRTRYRDFLNYIRNSNLRVTHMRISTLTQGNRQIFNQELEISASAIGAKAGSDFIQLSSYINPGNYNDSFIDIDLSRRNLLLDETTLVFLTIPPGSRFQIDFTLS